MIASLLSIFLQITAETGTSNLAAFFGNMGVATGLVFSVMGAAYGTAKAGVGVAAIGVLHPDIILQSVVPVIMAGMVGIYGLIIAVFLAASKINDSTFTDFQGFSALGAGLSVGLSSLAAGMCIGIVGDAGVRANAQQRRLFTGMLLMLVFAEALGLYGLIVGLILCTK
eukprot:TRINITY_DN169_c0_g1_i1.p1 TRINITY_DN169_c0_g1~~TRINITY_DN169_c0_g1_i1.p1  ORF type:complete len:169 (-),score=30.71 TRINITY_DN169_c0_g1_i1:57-563(-)